VCHVALRELCRLKQDYSMSGRTNFSTKNVQGIIRTGFCGSFIIKCKGTMTKFIDLKMLTRNYVRSSTVLSAFCLSSGPNIVHRRRSFCLITNNIFSICSLLTSYPFSLLSYILGSFCLKSEARYIKFVFIYKVT
jgi:hypothetical protein